jgi:hypothetical protein
MIYNSRTMSRQLGMLAVAAVATTACNRGSEYASSDTASASSTMSSGADTATTIRGTVASISPTEVVVAQPSGNVTVKLTQPFQVFDREPGKLDDVKDNVFVGVTSVKQPDGTEVATEIHTFPEALRGLGEGTRIMTVNPTAAAGGNSRMTNGAVTESRMSNGSVANANGSKLVVQFAGGSETITVPQNIKVTEIKPTSKTLATGDQVVIMAKKNADGTFSASSALLAPKSP